MLSDGFGKRSRVIHHVRPGLHDVAVIGRALDDHSPTTLFSRP
jgi:hypothetical protein